MAKRDHCFYGLINNEYQDLQVDLGQLTYYCSMFIGHRE